MGAMEALAMLENSGVAPQEPQQQSGDKRPASTGESRAAGAAKRLRVKTEVLAHAGSSTDDVLLEPVKMECCALAAADPDPEDDGGDEVEDMTEKYCPGCNRSSLHGRSFYVAGGRVEWFHRGYRGLWCRDCQGCWRVMYQTVCTLIMFGVHLKTPSNYAVWELELMAYVCLKRENVLRISKALLQSRAQSLQFVLDTLCLNRGAVAVMTLADHVRVFPGIPLNPVRLCTVLAGGASGPRLTLGYAADTASLGRPLLRFKRPGAFTMSAALVETEDRDDMELLNQAFGTEMSPESLEAAAEIARPRSRMEQKYELSKAAVVHLLKFFSGARWETVREAFFSPVLTRLLNARQEATALHDEDTMAKYDMLIEGMQHGKLAMKASRAWRVSGYQDAKLLALSPALSNLVEFLAELEVACHWSFMSLHYKVMFMESIETSKKIPEAMKTLEEKGLADLLVGEGDAGLAAVEGVAKMLRGVLLTVVTDRITSMDLTHLTAQRQLLAEEILEFRVVVEKFCEGAGDEVFSSLCDDIDHMAILFLCGTSSKTIKASEAQATKDYMELPRLAKLKICLTSTDCGADIYDCLENVLSRSANDVIADRELESATATCRSDAVPHKFLIDVRNPNEFAITNSFLVERALIGDVLVGALSFVQDCMKLWSAPRLEEAQGDVVDFTGTMNELLKRVDLIASALATAGLKDTIELLSGKDGSENPFADEGYEPVLVKKERPSETPFVKFLDAWDAFAEDKYLTDEARHEMKRIVLKIRKHEQSRSAVWSVVSSLAAFETKTFTELDMTHLQREWSTPVALQTNTLLSCCVALQDSLVSLESCNELDFSNAFTDVDAMSLIVYPKLAAAGDGSTLEAREIVGLPQTLLELPFNKHVRELLKESSSALVRDFCMLLDVNGVVLPAAEWRPARTMNLVAVVDALVDVSMVPSTATAANRFFPAHAAGTDALLPVSKFYITVQKVLVQSVTSECPMTPLLNAEGALPQDEALAVLEVHKNVAEAMAGLVYLRENFGADEEKLVEDNAIRKDVLMAMTFLENAATDGMHKLRSCKNLFKSIAEKELEWKCPAPRLELWLETCTLAAAQLRRCCVSAFIGTLKATTKHVEKLTPNTNSFLSDTTFVRTVARKQLLQKNDLSVATITLCKALQQMKQFQTEFKFEPVMEHDDEYKDLIGAARCVFSDAKRVVHLTAIVNVLVNLIGEGKHIETKKLLEVMPETFSPATLRKQLLQVVNKKK